MHSRRQPYAEAHYYMSNSSPSRGRSSFPSPRPLQAKPANNPSASSSRPGTAGTTGVDSLKIYAPIPPTGPHDPSRQRSGFSQPPLETTTPSQSRGFGVHSILNPYSETIQQSPVTTSTQVGLTGQTLLPPPTASPRIRKRTGPASPTRTHHGAASGTTGRRVLTPKSPATRTSSVGGRRNPTFHTTGPPLQTFTGPEPRIYTAEPGSADVPSLPPLTGTARAPFPGVQATDAWQIRGRPRPTGAPVPATQTASPSTSHTSLSQTEQTSPAFRYGQIPAGHQGPASFRQHFSGIPMGYSTEHGLRGPPEGYQAGQPAYQMTLETEQGPMVVPVELDMQQASKMADEKRKRNAGASARFRARRKEKEKEASQTISGLQQEIRELREERDFYRNERNFIREFATRQVGIQLPPRPRSPQFHRLTAPPGLSYEESHFLEDIGRARSGSAPAPQRRRTGDYQAHFSAATHQSPIPQPFGSTYGTNPPLPLPPPQIQGQGPGPYASPRSLPPGPPVSAATGPRSQSSYDPFRKDPFDRSWNPAR